MYVPILTSGFSCRILCVAVVCSGLPNVASIVVSVGGCIKSSVLSRDVLRCFEVSALRWCRNSTVSLAHYVSPAVLIIYYVRPCVCMGGHCVLLRFFVFFI